MSAWTVLIRHTHRTMFEVDSYESSGRKEELTLVPQKVPEMRLLLDEGTNGNRNDEESTSTSKLRYNWLFQKFSGIDSRQEAQEWLNRINYFAKINEWSDEEKLPVALRYLTGSARRSWFLQLDTPNIWTNFQRHFYESHIAGKSPVQKWEPSLTYFANKLSFYNEVGLNLNQAQEEILIGLQSNKVYLQCAGGCHIQSNHLLKHILKVERMNGSRRNMHCDAQRQLNERTIRQGIFDEYGTIPVFTYDITASCFQKIENETCLSMLKNIFRCHKKRSVPVARADSTKFINGSVLCQTTANSAAAIVKMVIVNGKMKVMGLIDHGSSDCLMRQSIASSGGWLPEIRNSSGTITIGNMIFAKELIYVHLMIDGVQGRVVPLFVMPDDALPYPLMVGRTWMEQRCIGYIRDEGGLRFFYLTNAQGLIDTLV